MTMPLRQLYELNLLTQILEREMDDVVVFGRRARQLGLDTADSSVTVAIENTLRTAMWEQMATGGANGSAPVV